MSHIRSVVVVIAVMALGGATMAFAGSGGSDRGGGRYQGDDDRDRGRHGRVAVAALMDAAGRRVGRVWMYERRREGVVHLEARLDDLPPGFHGFHIHTVGRCDPPGFTTAGGHFNPTGEPHGEHAGDLPSLLVTDDGEATLATVTDRFSIAD